MRQLAEGVLFMEVILRTGYAHRRLGDSSS